ncbi:hypothetical protein [Candidatus Mancarchaeum acidiphilum]|nr:hypothetical protein [Candidatus Mancarchaeum acidiphilum]
MYTHKDSKASKLAEHGQNAISIEESESRYWQSRSLKFLKIMDELGIQCGKLRVIYSDIPEIGYNKSEDSIYIDGKFLNAIIFSYAVGYKKGIIALMNHEIGHRHDFINGRDTSEMSAELNSINSLGSHPEDGLSQQISISMFASARSNFVKAEKERNKRINIYGLESFLGEEATKRIEYKAMRYYKLLVNYRNSANRLERK